MLAMHFQSHWLLENPLQSLALASCFMRCLSWISTLPCAHFVCYSCVCVCMNRSAKIDLMPRFAAFLSHRRHTRITTFLGMFGSPSPKPVKLWSDDAWVAKLKRTLQRSRFGKSDTARRYYDSKGRVRFQGTSKLKESQVYPRSFGSQVPWVLCLCRIT